MASLGLVAALLSSQLTCVITCPTGYYEAAGVCSLCSGCGEGQGASEACSKSHDTVCTNCSAGTFSVLRAGLRECAKCTECLPSRDEAVECSQFHDARCSDCASGYFLSISDDGESVCKKCSHCPRDHSAVHWVECEEAGLPLDQQCAPDAVSMLTLSSPSPSPTGALEPYLGTGRGGFLTESESDPSELTTATPPAVIGIATAVLSLLLATVTVVVSVVASVYTCRTKCRVQHSTSEQGTQLLSLEESGDDPPATTHQYRQNTLSHTQTPVSLSSRS